MDHSVIIKGLNNGIIVVLDASLTFELLKEKVSKKFKDSSKFLGNAQVALGFEGRKLSEEEQLELLNIISEQSDLQIVCLITEDKEKEAVFERAIEQTRASARDSALEQTGEERSKTNGQFYKGNLRSGQSLECDSSIVIIGDVNPGASVSSGGNIIVLGALRGTVFAGSDGNEKAFVLALDMSPVQIRIADTIARAPDNPEKAVEKEAKIAFLEDSNIYIEPLTKKTLSEREL